MNYCIRLGLLLITLLLPTAGFSAEFSGRSHATAMLLLSDSDQSVKFAGKSIFWFGTLDRELLDVVGEVIWGVCSGKREMDDDSLSWLVEGIGRARPSRYADLLDYCLSSQITGRTKSHIKAIQKDIIYKPQEMFVGGHIDLQKTRADLVHPARYNQAQLGERFNTLHKEMTLAEIYSLLGYPDEVGFSATSEKSQANPKARITALAITYKDVGAIHLYAEEGRSDWLIDNAMSVKGLMLSSSDGLFVSKQDVIAHGNGFKLSELADYLLLKNFIDSNDYKAILERSAVAIDPADGNVESYAMSGLGKVIFQSGNKEFEKTFVLNQIKYGNGLQLRYVTELVLENNYFEKEILEAALETIKTSRFTEDLKYADGLAWLCKIFLANGDIKYKKELDEISATATTQKIQKYARQAAAGLH